MRNSLGLRRSRRDDARRDESFEITQPVADTLPDLQILRPSARNPEPFHCPDGQLEDLRCFVLGE
jgi:hypothetical protein